MKRQKYTQIYTEEEGKLYAKKALGQNFLKSEKALNSIVSSGELSFVDTVLEIGPGRGALTKKILESGATVVAVEKDRDLIPILSDSFQKEIENKKFFLYEADILETELEKIGITKEYKLIANIPYYITGEIIRTFLEHKAQPSTMVLLVQKEVAERIVVRDGKQSILALSIQAYGEAKYIETVPSGAFAPSPKVDSAIVQIKNISKKDFKNNKEEKNYFLTIKTAFKSKRKKAFSNLMPLYTKEFLEQFFAEQNLDINIRPEKIQYHTWLQLSKHI